MIIWFSAALSHPSPYPKHLIVVAPLPQKIVEIRPDLLDQENLVLDMCSLGKSRVENVERNQGSDMKRKAMPELCYLHINISLVGGLEHDFCFSIYWE